MNTREFIASLVGSAAWPVAAVIIALLFRSKLQQLLEQQPTSLKVGPVQVEWASEVEEVKKELPSPPEPEGETLEFPDLTADLQTIAEASPAAAVIAGYQRVGDYLRRRISGKETPVEGDASALAAQAERLGIISSELVRAVDGLRNLRDIAVYRSAEVTQRQAEEFLMLVDVVLRTLASWLKPVEVYEAIRVQQEKQARKEARRDRIRRFFGRGR